MSIILEKDGTLNPDNLTDINFLNNLREGVIIVNKNMEITYCNSSVELITGIKGDSLKGNICDEKQLKFINLEGQVLCDTSCPVKRAIISNSVIKERLYINNEENLWLPIFFIAMPLKDKDGNTVGAIQLFSIDSSIKNLNAAYKKLNDKLIESRTLMKKIHQANEEINRKLIESTNIDGLTRVFNRKFFNINIPKMIKEAHKSELPMTMLFINLDNFRKINDRFGFDSGDSVIKKTSEIIAKTIRPNDILFRFNGDEFIVVQPEISSENASSIAEKILRNIKAYKFKHQGREMVITISIGLAIRASHLTSNMEKFTVTAEQALLIAKREGKDRIKILESD